MRTRARTVVEQDWMFRTWIPAGRITVSVANETWKIKKSWNSFLRMTQLSIACWWGLKSSAETLRRCLAVNCRWWPTHNIACGFILLRPPTGTPKMPWSKMLKHSVPQSTLNKNYARLLRSKRSRFYAPELYIRALILGQPAQFINWHVHINKMHGFRVLSHAFQMPFSRIEAAWLTAEANSP